MCVCVCVCVCGVNLCVQNLCTFFFFFSSSLEQFQDEFQDISKEEQVNVHMAVHWRASLIPRPPPPALCRLQYEKLFVTQPSKAESSSYYKLGPRPGNEATSIHVLLHLCIALYL